MVASKVYTSKTLWIKSVVDEFFSIVAYVNQFKRSAFIALAGGATPLPIYEAIAKHLASCPNKYKPILIIGDERRFPRTEAEHNETMIRRSFGEALNHVDIIGWNIKQEPSLACSEMAKNLEQVMSLRNDEHIFDACFLGLGADGHTASVFSTDYRFNSALALQTEASTEPKLRLSLSALALSKTLYTRFVVQSHQKKEALARLLSQDPTCPAVQASSPNTIAFILE